MVCHIFWETPISCFIAAIPGISLVIFCFMVCHYQENHMFKTRVWSAVVVSTYEPLLYPLSKSVESLEVKDECHRLVATIATWSMRCALKGKAPVTGPFGEPLTKNGQNVGASPYPTMGICLLISALEPMPKPGKNATSLKGIISAIRFARFAWQSDPTSMVTLLWLSKISTRMQLTFWPVLLMQNIWPLRTIKALGRTCLGFTWSLVSGIQCTRCSLELPKIYLHLAWAFGVAMGTSRGLT